MRPELAKEWDPNDNQGTPKDYSLGSNYKAKVITRDLSENKQFELSLNETFLRFIVALAINSRLSIVNYRFSFLLERKWTKLLLG